MRLNWKYRLIEREEHDLINTIKEQHARLLLKHEEDKETFKKIREIINSNEYTHYQMTVQIIKLLDKE